MDNQILAHTKYNCTYHLVFIPKYCRKVMYGKLGNEAGEILSTVCKLTGIEIIKGGVCPNYVYMYVSIPPKLSVSTAMSKLKGKSALMILTSARSIGTSMEGISGRVAIMRKQSGK